MKKSILILSISIFLFFGLKYVFGVTTSSVDTTTLNYLTQGIFAGVYVADGATAQSIPTGTTYTKITGLVTNGQYSNASSTASQSKIVLTKTGRYQVCHTMNYLSGTNNVVFKFAAFLNGVEQAQIHSATKISTGSDLQSAAACGFINVTSTPWDLDLRARHDNVGSVNLTPVYSNLTAHYVGS